MIRIRDARADDAGAIFAVHAEAFPSDAEARLVDRLRGAGKARVSLVAIDDAAGGRVIGHVLFSPVEIETADGERHAGLGLAPLAVLPARHRQGIGSALVRAGLESCRGAGTSFVVVLGNPAYYGRFGFARADARGVGNEYGAGAEFLAIELGTGAIPPGGGVARYAAEFAGVSAEAPPRNR